MRFTLTAAIVSTCALNWGCNGAKIDAQVVGAAAQPQLSPATQVGEVRPESENAVSFAVTAKDQLPICGPERAGRTAYVDRVGVYVCGAPSGASLADSGWVWLLVFGQKLDDATTSAVTAVIAQGLKGDQGASGPTGPKGDKGDKGDQGVAGGAGPRGEIGATGAVGATGPQGSIGPQGGQGVAGTAAPAAFGAASGASANSIYVAATGNVGIGTTTPSTAFEVNGQIKVAGGNPGAGKILTSDADGVGTWAAPAESFDLFPPNGFDLTTIKSGSVLISNAAQFDVNAWPTSFAPGYNVTFMVTNSGAIGVFDIFGLCNNGEPYAILGAPTVVRVVWSGASWLWVPITGVNITICGH